jgi:hypothetical protein
MPYNDSNVGFILEPAAKARLKEVMEGIITDLPQSYSVLIDHAGRIVEAAREPAGVQLEALSALSAGCYATTLELAKVMGEEEYSLLFRQEDDHQVYIWPVSGRALLVAQIRTTKAVDELEERLGGPLGRELISIVREAKMPEKKVPPPRIVIEEIPYEVQSRMKSLTAIIMDLQAKRSEDFNQEVKKILLKSREELIKAVAAQDWRRAMGLCSWTRQWLAGAFHLPVDVDPGKVVISLYSEIFAHLHREISAIVAGDRLEALYHKTYGILARKYTRVFVADSCMSASGFNINILWDRAQASTNDMGALAREFVPALDEVVRELLRIIYLARGADGRKQVQDGATAILQKYRDKLLMLGLDTTAGAGWSLLMIQKEESTTV